MMIESPRTVSIPPREARILSVSELTQLIKGCIESQFGRVTVRGEISNCKLHTSGHLYFTLKDQHAQISAALFRASSRRLKFTPEDGLEVLVIGRVSVYDVRGTYQIVVEEIEPAGRGALQLAFEQLKIKLEKEGLFSAGRKRPLPPHPERIGIVTSPTGAAIRDMLQILSRRARGVQILLYPCRVQGEGAADEISEGISVLNDPALGLEVLIVGRGGGSLEDLWAFNEEKVARAIAGSRLPVVSAVGHEVDFTIADFVADLRAPTPSAAAELVVRDDQELRRHLQNLRRRLGNPLTLVEARRMKLDHLYHAISVGMSRKLERIARCAEQLEIRVRASAPDRRLSRWREQLQRSARRLAIIQERLRPMRGRLERLARRISVLGRVPLSPVRHRLASLSGRLEMLSPLGILCRGYSIVRDASGGLVVSAGQVEPGTEVTIQTGAGSFAARVIDRTG